MNAIYWFEQTNLSTEGKTPIPEHIFQSCKHAWLWVGKTRLLPFAWLPSHIISTLLFSLLQELCFYWATFHRSPVSVSVQGCNSLEYSQASSLSQKKESQFTTLFPRIYTDTHTQKHTLKQSLKNCLFTHFLHPKASQLRRMARQDSFL